MALFHLHVFQPDVVAQDEEGVELPNLDAARQEAVRGARSIMCEELGTGSLSLDCHIDIEDSSGQVLATVLFREAIALTGLDYMKHVA